MHPHNHLILFAEDTLPYNQSVTQALRDAGYTVVSVTDGAAAIEALAQYPFTMVLTDYCMPLQDGGAVARAALDQGITKIIINSKMWHEIDPIPGVEIVRKMSVKEVVSKVGAVFS